MTEPIRSRLVWQSEKPDSSVFSGVNTPVRTPNHCFCMKKTRAEDTGNPVRRTRASCFAVFLRFRAFRTPSARRPPCASPPPAASPRVRAGAAPCRNCRRRPSRASRRGRRTGPSCASCRGRAPTSACTPGIRPTNGGP